MPSLACFVHQASADRDRGEVVEPTGSSERASLATGIVLRLLVLTIALMMLALLVPATTEAAPRFSSYVMRNVCTTSGGAYGYGRVLLRVSATEHGKSGANYFVFKARLQQRVSGTWRTVDRTSSRTPRFPDDQNSYTFAYRAKHAFTTSRRPLMRIVIRVEFWDKRSGPDVRLASHKHVSKSC